MALLPRIVPALAAVLRPAVGTALVPAPLGAPALRTVAPGSVAPVVAALALGPARLIGRTGLGAVAAGVARAIVRTGIGRALMPLKPPHLDLDDFGGSGLLLSRNLFGRG